MQTTITELSLDDLRMISGFEHLSNDDLHKLLESIKELALLLNIVPADVTPEKSFPTIYL